MSTTENLDALLRPDEFAARIRQSVPTVYRKIARGQLRAFRLDDGHGPLRIPESEVRRHLQDRAPGGSESREVRAGRGAPDGPGVSSGAVPAPTTKGDPWRVERNEGRSAIG